MEQWYNNKELFEMIDALKDEMSQTRALIKEYNGLRRSQMQLELRLKTVEDCLDNKKENKKDYQWLVGIIIGVAIAMITKFF